LASTPQLRVLAALAVLAAIAYIPAVSLPFIEDDCPNLFWAQVYGPASGWGALAHDAINRPRTTSFLYLDVLWRLFGPHPAGYYGAGILLHILNSWLVYALGRWRPLGYPAAALGAAFFALAEGHQEAVMWISGCNELLQFLFGVLAVWCWMRFLEDGPRRRRWYAASLAAFLFALLSKESAVIVTGLLLLTACGLPARRAIPALVPFAALGAASATSVFGTSAYSGRFRDGSFSLAAPFWLTLPHSLARLLWPWPLAGLAAAALARKYRRSALAALAWAIVALLPYCFLTYGTRIPSRQTYLASAGAAWLAGLALLALRERFGVRKFWAVAVLIGVQNLSWLWFQKLPRFRERAQPTQELIALARRTAGPIYVRDFPRPRIVAEQAVRLMAGRSPSDLIWDARDAGRASAVFSYVERHRAR
jgi:hypothetical protein